VKQINHKMITRDQIIVI